eukprot:327218-Chlamydomonas_euryale.AAC.4
MMWGEVAGAGSPSRGTHVFRRLAAAAKRSDALLLTTYMPVPSPSLPSPSSSPMPSSDLASSASGSTAVPSSSNTTRLPVG